MNAGAVYHCEVCNVNVNGENNWRLHLEGEKHRRRARGEDGGQFHCDLCNVDISGAQSMQEHINGRSHQNRLTMARNQQQQHPQRGPTGPGALPQGISAGFGEKPPGHDAFANPFGPPGGAPPSTVQSNSSGASYQTPFDGPGFGGNSGNASHNTSRGSDPMFAQMRGTTGAASITSGPTTTAAITSFGEEEVQEDAIRVSSGFQPPRAGAPNTARSPVTAHQQEVPPAAAHAPSGGHAGGDRVELGSSVLQFINEDPSSVEASGPRKRTRDAAQPASEGAGTQQHEAHQRTAGKAERRKRRDANILRLLADDYEAGVVRHVRIVVTNKRSARQGFVVEVEDGSSEDDDDEVAPTAAPRSIAEHRTAPADADDEDDDVVLVNPTSHNYV